MGKHYILFTVIKTLTCKILAHPIIFLFLINASEGLRKLPWPFNFDGAVGTTRLIYQRTVSIKIKIVKLRL